MDLRGREGSGQVAQQFAKSLTHRSPFEIALNRSVVVVQHGEFAEAHYICLREAAITEPIGGHQSGKSLI